MGSGVEGLAQGLGQEDGCGPDPDPGHGGQDLVKRVGLHQGHRPGRRHRPAERAGR